MIMSTKRNFTNIFHSLYLHYYTSLLSNDPFSISIHLKHLLPPACTTMTCSATKSAFLILNPYFTLQYLLACDMCAPERQTVLLEASIDIFRPRPHPRPRILLKSLPISQQSTVNTTQHPSSYKSRTLYSTHRNVAARARGRDLS